MDTEQAIISLTDIPTTLTCPDCGRHIQDIGQAQGFEVYTTNLLKAELAPARTPGYDVHRSTLYPGLTFQVKEAAARPGRTTKSTIDGRICVFRESPTWSWRQRKAQLTADWFILYGILGDGVYPFVLSHEQWETNSSPSGKGRYMRISTDRFSVSGFGVKQNRRWEYFVDDWPEGLWQQLDSADPLPYQMIWEKQLQWRKVRELLSAERARSTEHVRSSEHVRSTKRSRYTKADKAAWNADRQRLLELGLPVGDRDSASDEPTAE